MHSSKRQFSEKSSNEAQWEETVSRPADRVGVCLYCCLCEHPSWERAVRVIKQFRQTAGKFCSSAGAKFGGAEFDKTGFRFYSFHNSRGSQFEADRCASESSGNGVGEYRIRFLSQAGNAVVWEDQARQVHVGSGCDQSGIQTCKVKAATWNSRVCWGRAEERSRESKAEFARRKRERGK